MFESFDPYYQWLGIPPEEQPANHYQLLGIKWFEDNRDVISAAVDRQMLHLRTYQIGDYSDISQRLMNEVVSAKLCLLDPKRKAVYDQKLLEGDLATSIEAQKASGSTAFGPQLDALFDEAEQAEPGEMLHKPRRRLWKPSGRFVVRFVSLSVGVLLVMVLIATASWLVDNVRSRLHDGKQPFAVPIVPADPDAKKRPIEPRKPVEPEHPLEPKQPIGADGLKPPKPKPPIVEPAAVDPTKARPVKPDPKPSTRPSDASDAGNHKQTTGDRRLAVPSEDARLKANLQVDEKYGVSSDLGPLDKARLAKRLLKVSGAGIAVRDPAVRYEMLEMASRLAAEGGDLNLAFATIDKLGEYYKIDPLAAKVSRLSTSAASAQGPVRIRQVVKVAGNLIDEAVELKRFDTALRIVEVTLRVCQHSDGKPLRKSVANRRKDIRKQQERYDKIQTAKKTLEAVPDDGEANLIFGSYLCFNKSDWPGGLPLLAKGSDADLARLARRELEKPPGNIDEEIDLADGWWKLASKTFGPRKRPILLRAAYWYKRAQPKLTVGPKTKHVDKRLETIARLTEPKGD